jgi:hypothetical protein
MRTETTAKAGAAVAALLVTVGGRVAGQDADHPRKAKLEFRVLASWAGGDTHEIGTFGSAHLEEGGSTSGSMEVGTSPADDGMRCRSEVLMSPVLARTPAGPLPLWDVEGKVLRAKMDDIQIEYAWKRRAAGGPGAPPEAAYRGTTHLTEGGRALLDFVPAFEASSGCWHNLALELSASIPEDPRFAARRIAYDLWLDSQGHESRLTRRLQLIGKQGERVAFDYGTLRSKLPVAPPAGKDAYMMETTVTGSVRSRVQPDGSIELLLTATRGAHPTDGAWFRGAYGSKRVSAAPGETLRLELPAPNQVDDRANEPDTFRALAEQHIALVLTPTILD